jgi:2-succinyl-6-hydroxy-2,4-cyclohexadiene-1-carboxylate synthase
LVLVGEHDAKFTELGRRLVGGLRNAALVVVPDAGHSVHLEQPNATAAAIAHWTVTRGVRHHE